MMRRSLPARSSGEDFSTVILVERLAKQHGAPRRRSARILLRIPLLVNTADSSAETDWEPAETVMVSLHGAMIRTKRKFEVGDTLDIRVRDKDRSARARVVWRSSEVTPKGLELGFEIVDQTGFWDIRFPADRWSEQTRP